MEKQKKKQVKTNQIRYVIVFSILLVIALLISIFFILFYTNKKVYASSPIEEKSFELVEGQDKDIEEILRNNLQSSIREEMLTEEIDLEYTTIYEESSDLPKGRMQVVQQGRDGKQVAVTKKTYEGDNLIQERQSGNTVTKPAIQKIVQIGTGSGLSNTKPKKGDPLYVASYTLDMMAQPDTKSDKRTTLIKGEEVILLSIKKEWYEVQKGEDIGWVEANCLTNFHTNDQQDEKALSNKTLQVKLSKNMKLNQPSGLSLNQFNKILSSHSQDKNKIFEQNAQYFYYIEKQYNINGVFIAAVGIHESNWGTSKIAQNKKNLFGYGASDGSAYTNAYSFGTYAEGIDLIARVLVKYYLNPAGTKIYDNQVALGKYYTSPTLESVNKRYASDKNWANAVYQQMQNLYEKL